MSDWKIAMLLLLPLMMSESRLRTWAAVFGSSLVAIACHCHPAAYMVLDLFCGAVVLRHPVGIAQKSIGMLFAGMAMIDIGYLLSPQLNGPLFVWVMDVLAWAQLAILAVWGMFDVGEIAYRRVGHHRHKTAVEGSVQ